MELIMLGTGNAMVTRCYNTCFVLSSGEEYFLVDAGAETAFSSSWSKPEFLLQVFVRCL